MLDTMSSILIYQVMPASNIVEYFNQVIVLAVVFYLLSSISYTISLSTIERYGFPVLNSLSTSNSCLFYFVTLSSVFSLNCCTNSYDLYSFLISFVLLASLVFLLMASKEYTKGKNIDFFEYDILINFSILGLLIINSCDDFLCFYIALELQSLSFYVLANFKKTSQYCSEAAIKYFVLGALSSGILLTGLAFLYICFGSLNFETFEQFSFSLNNSLAFSGCVLFIISILFKLGAFPFHMWLCDVYEGSTVSVTALFSILPKVIILPFLIRIVVMLFSIDFSVLTYFMLFSGLASVCFASIAALYQKRVKRLLAYSTISHTGFMLLGLSCLTPDSVKSCIIYVVLYSVMTLCLFCIIFLSSLKQSQQKYIINWASNFERNPSVSIAFSIVLFSIAGVPPLAGFYSKLCIFFSLISMNQSCILVLLAVFSAISCFYYIKITKVMFFNSGIRSLFWLGSGSKTIEPVVSICSLVILVLLLNPNLIVNLSTLLGVTLYR